MSQIKILPHPQARHPRAQDHALIPELSVVIPTFKERGNIEILVQRLDAARLGGDIRRRLFARWHGRCGKKNRR
jgi:hypothetical protein